MSSRIIARISFARAGPAIQALCSGPNAIFAPSAVAASRIPDLRQPQLGEASMFHQAMSRGFAASREQLQPATETDPSVAAAPSLAENLSHLPGRSCGFQHQFEVIGAVDGPYEITPAAKFAVVEVGSHQFKVVAGDVIITERINGVDINDKLSFSSVMMLGSAEETIIGRPIVPGAEVIAAVEEQFLDAKKLSFKKRRRKDSKRLKGNRQPLTSLRILEVKGIEEAAAANQES